MPATTARGRGVRLLHAAIPARMRCVVVSWHPLRGECLRVVAEQESWNSVVCENAKELMQTVFCHDISLAVVDLPKISSGAYDSFRVLTEQLSELGTWNGTSGILLVVCNGGDGADGNSADGNSVQEEIWARQLGVWCYLPCVVLPVQGMTVMNVPCRQNTEIQDCHPAPMPGNHEPSGSIVLPTARHEQTDIEKKTEEKLDSHNGPPSHEQQATRSQQGLPLLFSEAREVLVGKQSNAWKSP